MFPNDEVRTLHLSSLCFFTISNPFARLRITDLVCSLALPLGEYDAKGRVRYATCYFLEIVRREALPSSNP